LPLQVIGREREVARVMQQVAKGGIHILLLLLLLLWCVVCLCR
jgi:hypothetical protein